MDKIIENDNLDNTSNLLSSSKTNILRNILNLKKCNINNFTEFMTNYNKIDDFNKKNIEFLELTKNYLIEDDLALILDMLKDGSSQTLNKVNL